MVSLCALPHGASADVPSMDADVSAGQEKSFSVKLQSRHIFDTDVNAQSGQINITESNFDAAWEQKLANKLPITLSIDYQHIDIDEDVPVELPDHLEGVSFGLSTKF